MKFPKLSLLLLLSLSSQFLFAQIKVTELDKNTIPKSIKYLGKIVNAVKYSNHDGEYIVITTETGNVKTDEGFKSADLYAYHFMVIGDAVKLTWQLHDFIKDCDLDLAAKYLPNSFNVTDLNNDGKAEVWLMYKTVCHGDVSPFDMKIIMHEGDKKYAMRGTNRVKVSDKKYDGGNYTFDSFFLNGSDLFRKYAIALWNKNLIETWK